MNTLTLTVEPQPIPLISSPDGVVRVAGTRVPLETVIRAFHQVRYHSVGKVTIPVPVRHRITP